MVSGPKNTGPSSQQLLYNTMSRLNPVTSLPAGLTPNVPQAMSAQGIVKSALKSNSLLPTDMRTTSDNPVFGNDAAQRYRDEYYRQSIQPLVDSERIKAQQSGNADSTFGATAISNLQAQGANQAFFGGEDYRNQLINQTLARRDSLFGNEARLAQQQNQLDVDRGLGVEGINTSRLGMMNQFQLGSAGILGNMYDNKSKQEAENERAKAAARASLVGGLFGLGGGLANTFMGGKRSSTPSGIGGGSNSIPSAPTGAFGSLDPMFTRPIPIASSSGGFRF